MLSLVIRHLLSIIILLHVSISDTFEIAFPKDFSNYICYATNDSIVIDGKLDDSAWGKVSFSNSFVDIEGAKFPAPLYDTKIKMLWDDDYLYIGAWMEEPHIWATYTERESIIFHENDFEIFIDPNGDTHNYYEIEVNALNTIWDLLLTKPYRDGGKAISNWNADGMKSAVHINGTINDPSDMDEYWSVEFALPWNSLKEHAFENRKPKDREQWRINFSRVQWRLDISDGTYRKRLDPEKNKALPVYNWVWSPQGAIAMHHPETWGYVQFSDRIVGSNKAKFVFNEDELCKWELRKIYYAQKRHKNLYGKFSDNLEVLEYDNAFCEDATIELKITKLDFRAKLKLPDSKKSWIIKSDGLVWSE